MFIFEHHDTLSDVILIKSDKFCDSRGMFEETFRREEFESFGIPPFIQENHSYSSYKVFRGLHYQLPEKAQGKLVYCPYGNVYDYVLDIKKDSPTYGKHIRLMLGENTVIRMIYIPKGYAHGFFVCDPIGAHIIYKITHNYYSPEHERCIRYNDSALGLYFDEEPIVSDKDLVAPLFKDAEI